MDKPSLWYFKGKSSTRLQLDLKDGIQCYYNKNLHSDCLPYNYNDINFKLHEIHYFENLIFNYNLLTGFIFHYSNFFMYCEITLFLKLNMIKTTKKIIELNKKYSKSYSTFSFSSEISQNYRQWSGWQICYCLKLC